MESNHLDPEYKQILLRAEEINHELENASTLESKYSEVLSAATEAGYSRDSVLQAIRERQSEKQISEGDHGQVVFAKSGDGAYYGAVVVKPMGNLVRVRFLNGGEAALTWAEIKPFTLTPGQKVQIKGDDHGHGNFWWGGQVVRVNPISRSVTVRLWDKERIAPLESVRLSSEDKSMAWRELFNNKALLIVGTGVVTWAIFMLIFGPLMFHKAQPATVVAPVPPALEAPAAEAVEEPAGKLTAAPPQKASGEVGTASDAVAGRAMSGRSVGR